MTWWDDFWTWAENSQLGANVVGGLIVAVIVALVGLIITLARSSLRKKVWGGVGRFFKWIGAIRLTTTARIEKEYERGVDEGWAGHEREVAEQEANPTPKGVRINYDADPHEALAPKPKLPAPKPRWRIYDSVPEGDGYDFVLANNVERSVAVEARLKAHASYFEFYDGAHWADLSGVDQGAFRGKVSNWARDQGGVDFIINWIDENGNEQQGAYKMSAYHPSDPDSELDPF